MGNDIYKTWDGKHFQFTLNKIAAISDGLIKIPQCFQQLADEPIAVICSYRLGPDLSKGLNVRFLPQYNQKNYAQYVSEAEKGVVIVSHKELLDANGNRLPMILMPSLKAVQNALLKLGSYMKTVFPMPTICLTGSIGKTTTTLFMESLFKQRHQVFVSGRNYNISEAIIERMIEAFGSDYNYHIQETGGGGPGVVENSAKFLTPDAFAMLNLYPHHLVKYKTTEAILHDKASLDRFAKEGAFGVINIDDDMLRNYKFKSRIVTCGIQHKEADYVAENIRQDGIWLRMDIVHHGKCVPISINIPGAHNAYNAVIAFAMAKEWGLTDEEIQAGFQSYRSRGVRQNLCEIAGRILYIDCFNTSVDSIKSCLQALDTIEPKEGGRRIAILGGENALGDQAFSANYEAGLEFAMYHADEFVFIGLSKDSPVEEWDLSGYSYAVYEGARRVIRDRPVSFFDRMDLVADKLVRETKPGDVILFKGHFKLPFWPMIDRAFGTSFTANEPLVQGELWRNRNFRSKYYAEAGGSNIFQCTNMDEHITIPNTIISKPVSRIGGKVFANRENLKRVDFGVSVQNIGAQSFMGCTALTNLHIPANVIYVEREAFANCTGLEEVRLEGVLHIEEKAFAGCSNLKTIRFTNSCQTIERNAFAGCSNVVIIAPEGSVAHNYAVNNGIAFRSED